MENELLVYEFKETENPASKRLNWERLLSTKRVADVGECKLTPSKQSQFAEPRSAFERDYDQLIFSYPFRRLQDKTQVIPFPEFDFVHTRLTHSLEVASIGRSFGKMAADIIFAELNNKSRKNLCSADIGALVAAACLAHDIGNPPFGHSGEDSISNYFENNAIWQIKPPNLIDDESVRLVAGKYIKYNPYSQKNEEIQKEELFSLTKKWCDLIKFEGNANGFKIITRNCERGINPTFALLGAFTKYPRESWVSSYPKSTVDLPKSQKKHGFFQEQKELFNEVSKELGLIKVEGTGDQDIAFKRHPLAFLVEAADDIAYTLIDFEDGCRHKLIDFDKKYKLTDPEPEFKKVYKSPMEMLIEIASIDESYDETKIKEDTDFKESISYLRSKAINVLVHSAFKIFENNYEDIMTGKFDASLVDCIKHPIIVKNLKYIKDLIKMHVYNYRPVLEMEASGFEVMGSLIEDFAITSQVCYSCNEIENAKQKKIKSLLPSEFRPEEEAIKGDLNFNEKYKRIMKILDYVSGMTDGYAISLFRKMKGISLPYR